MRPRPDGRDTRNARGRATVRAIEREAVRLALEHGAAALTVDQICAAVRITQRSFFNHFDTKDDALLGWDLPRISEERTASYLAEASVGVLTGAMTLVDVPREMIEDPELMMSRFRVLAATPSLAERQSARLRPLAAEVSEIVLRKLVALAGPDADVNALRASANAITSIAAALIARPPFGPDDSPLPDPSRPMADLHELRWIWDRLI